MSLSYKLVNSPVGVLKLVASEKGLVAILWENDDPRRVRLGDLDEELHHPLLVRTEKELSEYFGRKRLTFSIPLEMRGTPFQRQVWEFLLGIPLAKHAVTATSQGALEIPRPVGPWEGQTVGIRFLSLFRATESSERRVT